ncbi:MAG: hypothetical protein LBH25_11625 [Fibromonadaceae bacterium]|nr:hypothetical protein [Fibromonadaceae bacterium]
MPIKKKTAPQKKTSVPATKQAVKPKAKEAKKAIPKKPEKKAAKTIAKEKPAAKPKAKPAAKKTAVPAAKPKAVAKAKKVLPKKQETPVEQKSQAVKPQMLKSAKAKAESLLIVPGVKFMKVPFFLDVGDEKDGKHKRGVLPKSPEKPTASSRPKVGNTMDTKDMVELLSQQLELENKMYFEGCEGQTCVKCGVNEVDPKYYVDKSLGHCTECAIVLRLGESKEGVFSDAQQELLRRSMEKSIKNARDIDENNIESVLGDIDIDDDSLDELALLTAEEEAET